MRTGCGDGDAVVLGRAAARLSPPLRTPPTRIPRPLRLGTALLVIGTLLLCTSATRAQDLVDSMLIRATSAATWSRPPATDVVLLRGPVRIELDRAELTADEAVIWLTPATGPDAPPGAQDAEIALVGQARLARDGVVRSGDRLFVTARLSGAATRITADERVARDHSDDPLFHEAQALRLREAARAPLPPPAGVSAEPLPGRAATRPAGADDQPQGQVIRQDPPLTIASDLNIDDTVLTDDGKVAVVFSGGILLAQQRVEPSGRWGEHIQLQGERGVLFTTLDEPRAARELAGIERVEQAITSAYLEGDVRITVTPPRRLETGRIIDPRDDVYRSEQRLEAERVYYDFTTDRAVLTDAVFRTFDPARNIPITLRADTLRQLSREPGVTEFGAEGARLSTSSFAVPSFALGADRVYVRQEETGDPRLGDRVVFLGRDVTFRPFGVPAFWLPVAGGSFTERGLPLRQLSLSDSSDYGFGVETNWGLFETLGQVPPDGLDVGYSVDWFDQRGWGLGLDADYDGGFVMPTTRQPWNFVGELDGYVVPDDDGIDRLGRFRRVDPDDSWRGRALWRHQHFFPSDWQMQLQAAWISDPTFLEEWYGREFDTGLPQDTSLYLKHQQGTEAITFLASVQPNNFVTTADLLQEQFEVERVPEVGYHRIGDSWGETFTFFSSNTVAGLRFNQSEATLVEQGFTDRSGRPGLPSLGVVPFTEVPFTGGGPPLEDDVVYRGDFRQQIDYPFSAGQFRVVPYVMGRLTAYTDSPDDTPEERAMAGAGVRVGTAFWRVFNDIESRLFDIRRVRHIVEPELHLFTSAATIDRGELFIYDEPVDGVTDLSAISVGLKQRWQTKRGAPDRLRSADFFSFNLFLNLFSNEPPDELNEPADFRGVYFPSLPEASVPRDSLNADALWRISDTTLILADAQQNLEEMDLATASIGLAAQRGDRLSYYVGMRYIDELDASIASVAADYALSSKYALSFTQSYDFGDAEGTVYTSANLQRRFDRFTAIFTFYHSERTDESGFRFTFYPHGLGVGLGSETLGSLFGP